MPSIDRVTWENVKKAADLYLKDNSRESTKIDLDNARECAYFSIAVHKYNPKYIFLTECSSFPHGYVLREALYVGFPKEPLPKFYRVDPRQVIEVIQDVQQVISGETIADKGHLSRKSELEDFLGIELKDKEGKILIYDEDWSTGKSPGSILALLIDPVRFGFSSDIQCLNVKINVGESDNFDTSRLEGLDLKLSEDRDIESEIYRLPIYFASRLTIKGKYGYNLHYNRNFRAKIKKKYDKKDKVGPYPENPLECIVKLKRMGNLAGEIIKVYREM